MGEGHFLRTRRDGGDFLRGQHDAGEAAASHDARDESFGGVDYFCLCVYGCASPDDARVRPDCKLSKYHLSNKKCGHETHNLR